MGRVSADPAACPVFVHHPRRHAAVRTREYVYAQLIPYIGNKRKLLSLVAKSIERTGVGSGTFVDLFAGSTVVARFAKSLGLRVVASDWEPYSFEIANGTVALNRPPDFRHLGGAQAVLDTLNALQPLEDYVTRHLCPKDDDHADPDNERMFFTRSNGMRIDAIRERLAAWERSGSIGAAERAYVLASLLYAVSYVSNTSGLFKAYHRGWGGKTGTALYRILSTLTLRSPVLLDNSQANLAVRQDAHELAGRLRDVVGSRPDIVYLDPPYNQHPYGSNYHVLNTVALWDKPPLDPRVCIDGRTVDKSAIRKDWRTQRRSAYNSAAEAPEAFRRLVDRIDARWLLMSYSTDGNIPLETLLGILAARGTLAVFTKKYKRYRVSTPRMSAKSHNVEFVAVVDLDGKPSLRRASRLAQIISEREGSLAEIA